ncbi:MAG: response regulator [Candidatus Aminicenantales bacterium]
MSETKKAEHSFPIDYTSALARVGGDERFLKDLLLIYTEDVSRKCRLLEKAIIGKDFRAIQTIAHSLKGSSLNLSVNGLLDACCGLETAGKSQDLENARALLVKLRQDFKKLETYLPSLRESPQENTQKIEQPTPEEEGLTILAADDSEASQLLLKAYASQAGFSIDVVSNGKEAVEHFVRKSYAIVFLDIHMPELDGFETLNRIRQIEYENCLPRTPIVALTGSSHEEEGSACLAAGFDDFVEKSFDPQTMTETIRKHVQNTDLEASKIQLDESIRSLVPDYIRNRKKDLHRLREALETQDYDTIEDLGHKMKGSGRCYGFDRLSSLGHLLETHAREKAVDHIEKAITNLEKYLDTLRIE